MASERNFEMETDPPVTGNIRGIIPIWLEGELVRVGPGIQKIGDYQYNHCFDGLAVLHKFTLQDGKAFYKSRALQSDAYKKNMDANRIVVSEFGTRGYLDPCESLFGRIKSNFTKATSIFTGKMDITDNCSVNVTYYGDQLYATTETNFVRRIDPKTLDTIGEKTNITDYIAINTATAHPHVLEDGTIINAGNIFRHVKGPHYGFIKISPSYNSEETSFASAKLIAEIPARQTLYPSYFHSFGITQSGKLIFIEQPFCINVMGFLADEFHRKHSYCHWMKWYRNKKTRFHIISLEDGNVHPVKYEAEDLFVFHHINCYEEDDEIIVDVAAYNDGDWVSQMTETETKSGNFSVEGSARRYVLPLNSNMAGPGENMIKTNSKSAAARLRQTKGKRQTVDLTPHHLTKEFCELPRINYKYNGRKYSYFYGLEQRKPSTTFEYGMDTICKVNTITGEKVSWEADDYLIASEPIFVADPIKQNGDEDDGVILSVVLSDLEATSVYLLILNAKDMTEIGWIEFKALGTVTGTLHGQWAQSGSKVHFY